MFQFIKSKIPILWFRDFVFIFQNFRFLEIAHSILKRYKHQNSIFRWVKTIIFLKRFFKNRRFKASRQKTDLCSTLEHKFYARNPGNHKRFQRIKPGRKSTRILSKKWSAQSRSENFWYYQCAGLKTGFSQNPIIEYRIIYNRFLTFPYFHDK